MEGPEKTYDVFVGKVQWANTIINHNSASRPSDWSVRSLGFCADPEECWWTSRNAYLVPSNLAVGIRGHVRKLDDCTYALSSTLNV